MSKEDKQLLKELKEQVEKLTPFEKHFENAKHNYMIIRPQDLNSLLTARYGTDWKSFVKKQVMTCATCKLNEIKKIGMEYSSMKATIQQLEESDKKKNKKDTK